MAEYDALVQQREIVRQQQDALNKQGAELDRKIAGLKQSLQGLSLYSTAKNEPPELTKYKPGLAEIMASVPSIEGFGKGRETAKTLTECCRDILTRSYEWMSPLQVRQSLHAAGFDFSEYKSNPSSSIHTTLKRIAESGQAESRYDINSDETLYRWKRDGTEVEGQSEMSSEKIAKSIVQSKRKK